MRRGVPGDAFTGRPHIAIANTASDLTPCNAHLTEVAASVKNGVYEAGGIPLELPVVSLGETLPRPTAMLWRNMAAMATEEMLRANPIDGVVLLGGCDKTIPSLLMAAASVDLPAVVVPGGPMLTGTFRGVPLGCGTDVWRMWDEVRAGTLSAEQFTRSESAMIRSRGHCNTMGTASTMALVAEAFGTVVPGVAGTPAADSRLLEAAHGTGRLVVEMVAADRRPSTFLTRASFANAVVVIIVHRTSSGNHQPTRPARHRAGQTARRTAGGAHPLAARAECARAYPESDCRPRGRHGPYPGRSSDAARGRRL